MHDQRKGKIKAREKEGCGIVKRWSKAEGKVELITGMFLLVFLVILLGLHIQIMLWYTTSLYMEDALAASNLASAVVDIEEYGMTHVIQIAGPREAYGIYREALKTNLQLDDNWEGTNKELISGKVEVLQYIIYNVNGGDITIYQFGESGSSTYQEMGGLGRVRTPDGILIESTSIYSRIGFPVEGILGINVYAEKEKSVDVVSSAVSEP